MAKRVGRQARSTSRSLVSALTLLGGALLAAPVPAPAEEKTEAPRILQQGVLKGTTLPAAKAAAATPVGGGKAEAGPQPEPPTKPLPAIQHTPALPRDGRNKGGPQPEPPTVQKTLIHGPSSLPPSHQRPAGLPSIGVGTSGGPAASLPVPGGAQRAPGLSAAGAGHAAEVVEGSLFLVSGPSACVRVPSTISIQMSRHEPLPSFAKLALRPAGGGAPVARLPVSLSGRTLRADVGVEHRIQGGDYLGALEDREGRNLAGSVPVSICPTGSLTVRVRMEGCSAGAGELILEAEPWPAGGSAARFPLPRVATGSDLELVYRRDDVPLRRWRVVPRLPSGLCPGGAWFPELGVADLDDHPASEMDFRYSVGGEETRIGANRIATLIELALSGVEIRLNNYDPSRRGNSRFVAGDAFVDMPDHLGGRRTGINVPEQAAGPLKYYVRDVNSVSHTVRTDGDAFRVRFVFESAGDEIKGHCFGDALDGCLVGRDDSAPDGSLDNLRLDVLLRPIRFTPAGGGPATVTFEVSGVDMSFDLRLNGLGSSASGLVAALVRGRVLPEASDKVAQSISAFETRGQIADQLRRILDENSVGDVESVALVGNEMVLHHRPAG